MSESQPTIVPYEERFGLLKPRNAAACIMQAIESMNTWEYARSAGDMVQFPMSDNEYRMYLDPDSTQRPLRQFALFVNATASERAILMTAGLGRYNFDTQPFKGVLSNAVNSLIERDRRYAFLLDVVEAPDQYARPLGCRTLSRSQRSFLGSWRNHYIGIPYTEEA